MTILDQEAKRLMNGPGLSLKVARTIYAWVEIPGWRQDFALFYIKHIYNSYCHFFSWITQFFPFSLFYTGRWIHAKNKKAREILEKMETIARDIKLPISVYNGARDRTVSYYFGRFASRPVKKSVAVGKLQNAFQEKIGTVYVQEQEVGFRILVDNSLIN